MLKVLIVSLVLIGCAVGQDSGWITATTNNTPEFTATGEETLQSNGQIIATIGKDGSVVVAQGHTPEEVMKGLVELVRVQAKQFADYSVSQRAAMERVRKAGLLLGTIAKQQSAIAKQCLSREHASFATRPPR